MMDYAIWIIIGLAVVALIFLLIMQRLSRKTKQGKLKKAKAHKGLLSTPAYLTIFMVLEKFPFTQQGIRKLNIRLLELGFFDAVQSRVNAVQVYITTTLIQLGVVLFGFFAFGDLFMGLCFLVVATVIKSTFITKQLDKNYFKMYKQLQQSISLIRQEYMRTGSVSEALSEITAGSLVAGQISKIASILTETNAETLLEEFYAAAPVKVLQTLAGVCYNVEKGGDTTLYDGTSNFIQSLSYIAAEINFEIRRLYLQKTRFGSLEMLPVLPIIAVPLLQGFLGGTIPATSTIYNGPYGYITRIIIVALGLMCYKLISSMNTTMVIKYDDRMPRLVRLYQRQDVRKFVKCILPKSDKKLRKKLLLLKNSLSRQTIDLLYLKKSLFAGATFIVCLVLIIFSVFLGKQNLYESLEGKELSSSVDLSNAERVVMLEIDKAYIAGKLTDEELKAELSQKFPRLNALKIDEQAARIQVKKADIENTQFRFWMLWIAIFAGFVAWKAPEIMLRYRNWLIKNEAEEDTLQLQTVIAVLMNTPMDTLSVLDWLSKHSRVHRQCH
jgi:hypothetical protein